MDIPISIAKSKNRSKKIMIPAEIQMKKSNVVLCEAEEQCNAEIQLLQNWHNFILNYKTSLITCLDETLNIIMKQILVLGGFNQKLKELGQFSDVQQKKVDDLQLESQYQQQGSEQVRNTVKKQLQQFQSKYFNNLDEQFSFLNQQQSNKIIKDIVLIKESCKKENQRCLSFAFNKNYNIFAVGCKDEIIIYEFNKGIIGKELQRLANHNNDVTCLQFMNNSNFFISGSKDQMIIIWDYDFGKNKYFAQQIIKDHNKSILCIEMSKNEDLLISSSMDNTLKFWSKLNNKWSCRQTIDTEEDNVFAISLNELEDKLITCGGENVISVMIKGPEDNWNIVQTISVSIYGSKLCFTTGDQFAFQPQQGDNLEVYQYNQEMQKFEILKNIKIQFQINKFLYFPCQYIKEKKLLSVKHGQNVNFFKVEQNGNYQLIQTIEFKDTIMFGRLTDDGQYLITWDQGTKQIQVRELKYL